MVMEIQKAHPDRWAMLKRIRKPVSYALGIIIFVVLCARLYQGWRALPADSVRSIDFAQVAVSLLLLCGAYLIVSMEWLLTLRALGEKIPWRISTKVWFLSLAMRYLPGGVWSYVGRAYLGIEQHVTKRAMLASLVIESVLRVLSELTVFAFSLWFWSESGREKLWAGAAMGTCIALGIVLVLAMSNLRVRRLLARIRWLRVDRWLTIRSVDVSGLLVYYTFSVVAVGSAFYWLVNSVYPVPLRFVPICAGVLALASTVGFLVPFLPQGLGVREGLLVALLSYHGIPPTFALVIGIGSRVWLTLGELIWVGVAIVL